MLNSTLVSSRSSRGWTQPDWEQLHAELYLTFSGSDTLHHPAWEQLTAVLYHLNLFRHTYEFRRRVLAFLRLPMGSTAGYQPLPFGRRRPEANKCINRPRFKFQFLPTSSFLESMRTVRSD